MYKRRVGDSGSSMLEDVEMDGEAHGGDVGSENDYSGGSDEDKNAKQARLGAHHSPLRKPWRSSGELASLIILTLLYVIQGVPLGLSFGSLPYVLKGRLSYTQIGIFSLASYPYSTKLLWAPCVDSFFWPSFGRRKSWIVPMQALCGALFIWVSTWVDEALNEPDFDIYGFTGVFFTLVLLAATQDIAVDGWAVEMLPPERRSYASTVQTVGLQIGFFMSFTVFLALNSAEFCNAYLRSEAQQSSVIGILSLSTYMWFWGIVYFVMNAYLILVKREAPFRGAASELQVTTVYSNIFRVLMLPAVKRLVLFLLFAKVGFMCADAVTALKLLEKGFRKQDLALFALIDFPVQIFVAVSVGQYTSVNPPLETFALGFKMRFLFGALGSVIVFLFPGTVSWFWFFIVMVGSVLYSVASNVMFVALGSFYCRIADERIGGTYLTLLNAVSNLGGTWPKVIVLAMVDFLTDSRCENENGEFLAVCQADAHSIEACSQLGGTCATYRDGYYAVAALSLVYSVFVYVYWLPRHFLPLGFLNEGNWRVK